MESVQDPWDACMRVQNRESTRYPEPRRDWWILGSSGGPMATGGYSREWHQVAGCRRCFENVPSGGQFFRFIAIARGFVNWPWVAGDRRGAVGAARFRCR